MCPPRDILRVGETRSAIVDGLPTRVEINGRSYPFRQDFRCGILLTQLFEDETLREDGVGRVQIAVKLFSPPLWEAMEQGEVSLTEAFEAVAAFYTCGKESKRQRSGRAQPIMDFSEDEERIIAAFRQVYGIDLCTASLHWWMFLALLQGLPEDCPFMGVVRLRNTDIPSHADEDTRRRLRMAKAAVRIRKNGKDGRTK